MVYFQGHPAVRPELDLVEEKYSHDMSIDQEINPETALGKLGAVFEVYYPMVLER